MIERRPRIVGRCRSTIGAPVNVISSGHIVWQILKSIREGAGGGTAVCGRGTSNEIVEVVGVGESNSTGAHRYEYVRGHTVVQRVVVIGQIDYGRYSESSRIEIECSGENKIFHLPGLESVGHRHALGAIQSRSGVMDIHVKT